MEGANGLLMRQVPVVVRIWLFQFGMTSDVSCSPIMVHLELVKLVK